MFSNLKKVKLLNATDEVIKARPVTGHREANRQ